MPFFQSKLNAPPASKAGITSFSCSAYVAATAKAEAAAYDARGPLAEIQKSIEALSERIESVTSSPEVGETIQKSAEAPSVTVPSTEDLASMSWSEVHNLATRAFNPE